MTEFEKLESLAKGLGFVPPGLDIIIGKSTCADWKPGFCFIGFNQVQAVLVPVAGGCPVRLETVWTDARIAMGAAEKMARLAAKYWLPPDVIWRLPK